MHWLSSLLRALFILAVVGLAVWLLGLGDVVRSSLAAGHLLDWVMGGLCLVWLLVILKAPWDLYFQAQAVAFEQERSRERNVALTPGRESYIRVLRKRLGWLAVGAHLLSAALVAGVAYWTGGVVGYYFAVFYLVSTVFRPAVAGYVYMAGKLRALGEEARYPREDVVEIREKLAWQEMTLRAHTDELTHYRDTLQAEARVREGDDRDLRERLHALGREFEVTASRLTDNQEVINGIQAFVRLIAQSSRPA
uniref:Uncharacterized protein n=1 Tax=uncultured Armatimonadetes bacterium TaxID=157466 RepID=A0A6J4HVH3_9BACT|nr:hypothetical protein AVDCRST_MAG63-1150 [uncultured Armatimonadetes bacterium]